MERLNFNNTEAQIRLTLSCTQFLKSFLKLHLFPLLICMYQFCMCSVWSSAPGIRLFFLNKHNSWVQNLFPHSRTCPTSKHPFPRFIKCFFHSQASGHTYFLRLKGPLPLNLFLEYLYLYFKTEFKCHFIYKVFFL